MFTAQIFAAKSNESKCQWETWRTDGGNCFCRQMREMAWGTNEGQNIKIKVLRQRPSGEPSKVERECCHRVAAF